jgi:predicted dienelactone hydrolase
MKNHVQTMSLLAVLYTSCRPVSEMDSGTLVFESFQAGMRDISFIDSRGKELVMTVWYPTIVEDDRIPDAYEPFTIAINAYKATTPVVKEAPLIAFSHGYFSIRYQSAFLMEHLAEQGFVVLAVDHPHNTLYDFDDEKTAEVLLERPDDVRASVDKLIELSNTPTDPFYQMVDDTQYVAMGHSFGSHTASVLGGGTLNYDGLRDYCNTNPNERACDYLATIEATDLSIHGTADSRVTATIPISPGLWYTFGSEGEGLADMRSPLIIAGTEDGVLKYDTEAIPFFEALSRPKVLFSMANTGHYGMTNICDIAGFLSEECTEDGWRPVEDVQEATNEIITAYLHSHFTNTEFDPTVLEKEWLTVTSE